MIGADGRTRTCDEHSSLRSRRSLSTNFSTSARVPCARFELALSSLRTRWRRPLAQHGLAPPMAIQPTMTRSTGGRLQQPTPRAERKSAAAGIEPRFQPWQGRRLPLSHDRGVPEGRIEQPPATISAWCPTTGRLGSDNSVWRDRPDSNWSYEGHDRGDWRATIPLPSGPQPDALPIELQPPCFHAHAVQRDNSRIEGDTCLIPALLLPTTVGLSPWLARSLSRQRDGSASPRRSGSRAEPLTLRPPWLFRWRRVREFNPHDSLLRRDAWSAQPPRRGSPPRLRTWPHDLQRIAAYQLA